MYVIIIIFFIVQKYIYIFILTIFISNFLIIIYFYNINRRKGKILTTSGNDKKMNIYEKKEQDFLKIYQ